MERVTLTVPMAGTADASQITVRGLLGIPEGISEAKPAPAILHIHGGGQTASEENVDFFCSHGYICMSFDWTGPGKDRPVDEVSRYPLWMEALPEQPALQRVRDAGILALPQYQAVGMARACLDRLARDPRVQSDRIGIYGISWGGLIAWIVNGTHSRVRCAVPVYGVGGVRERDMPYNAVWNKLPDAARREWATTMEPIGYAKRQHGAVLFIGPTNDFFGSPETFARLIALLPKSARADYPPDLDHCFDASAARTILAFFAHHLSGEPALPSAPMISATRDDSGIRVTSDLDQRPRTLWYADASVRATERMWRSVRMTTRSGERSGTERDTAGSRVDVCEGFIRVMPEVPVFCYVRATDRNCATLSSDMLYLPRPSETAGTHEPGHGTEIFHALASEERVSKEATDE